ncbi:hypothetical protein L1049_028160 [Liquidambar formosana]|uniref:C2 domain-containing protein n=1 Tax=Liquidambar formosana TaxID=63359 RepID=A0AAP0WW57_LIQFO
MLSFAEKKVEIVVPFEEVNSGELTVRLVMKEWQFSDGSHCLSNYSLSSEQSLYGSSNFLSRTGRKINVTVVEGKDLIAKDKSRKADPFVKLQYGKAVQRTKTFQHSSNPSWNEKFEFDETGSGDYLKIKCFNEETFGNDNIGSARVNLEGLVEGSMRDGSTVGPGNGWIELVLIEARDLVAADIRGTSDPYVRVHYGNSKRKTKVMYKTLNPQWHQTLEFPDDGSPLTLHVKDHNAVLPTSSIGDCVVEYQRLPPNQMSDKWIPLQGVKRGEIHIQITRKVPEIERRPSLDSESSLIKAHQLSNQMKQLLIKCQSIVEDCNIEGLSTAFSELESLTDMQEEYMVQLETEQMLLLNKIKELGQEFCSSSPSLSRRSSNN